MKPAKEHVWVIRNKKLIWLQNKINIWIFLIYCIVTIFMKRFHLKH